MRYFNKDTLHWILTLPYLSRVAATVCTLNDAVIRVRTYIVDSIKRIETKCAIQDTLHGW